MGRGSWAFCVRPRTTSTQWNVPGRYGPYGELFFLMEKEPVVLRELIRLGPSIPVETVKACALVGLHMMAEDHSWRTDSGSSFSSNSSSENNVGNDALFLIRLQGSSDTIASSYKIGRWQDSMCQEYTKSKGDIAGLVSERALLLKEKEVNDRSF